MCSVAEVATRVLVVWVTARAVAVPEEGPMEVVV